MLTSDLKPSRTGRKKVEEKYARYDLFPTTHSSMVANYDYILRSTINHHLQGDRDLSLMIRYS